VLNSTSNRILVIKRDVMRFFVNGDKMRQVDQSLFKAVQSKLKKSWIHSFNYMKIRFSKLISSHKNPDLVSLWVPFFVLVHQSCPCLSKPIIVSCCFVRLQFIKRLKKRLLSTFDFKQCSTFHQKATSWLERPIIGVTVSRSANIMDGSKQCSKSEILHIIILISSHNGSDTQSS
jgi:hypothetical protein